MFDWVTHQMGVGVLVVVFTMAALHKLRSFRRFRASMAAYEIVPDLLVGWFAPLVVGAEVLTVLLLLVHEGRGVLMAFTLLGVYSLAMSVNLFRGRTEIDCGCGDLPTPLSRWLIVRNLALMGLALLAGRHPEVTVPFSGWLLVAAGVLAVTSLYLIAEHLLANLPYVRGRYG